MATVDELSRARVEAALPPMKHLWGDWDRVASGVFDPEKDQDPADDPAKPWANATQQVKKLMQQVKSHFFCRKKEFLYHTFFR